jgi:hypothetical protein
VTKEILIKHINYSSSEVKGEIEIFQAYTPGGEGLQVQVALKYASGGEDVISIRDKSDGDCQYEFKLENKKPFILDAVQLFNMRILLRLMDVVDSPSQEIAIYEYKEIK